MHHIMALFFLSLQMLLNEKKKQLSYICKISFSGFFFFFHLSVYVAFGLAWSNLQLNTICVFTNIFKLLSEILFINGTKEKYSVGVCITYVMEIQVWDTVHRCDGLHTRIFISHSSNYKDAKYSSCLNCVKIYSIRVWLIATCF